MPRIELAPELGEDFDRILDHLARHDAADPPSRIREIIQANRYVAQIDTVFVLALHGQREAGYTRA